MTKESACGVCASEFSLRNVGMRAQGGVHQRWAGGPGSAASTLFRTLGIFQSSQQPQRGGCTLQCADVRPGALTLAPGACNQW